MRTATDIFLKRKKLRKKLHSAVFDYGKSQITENCKHWITQIERKQNCVFLCKTESGDLRGCPNAKECRDFENRYTNIDLEEKYKKLSTDDDYLARNYRDLFILNWVLGESEPSFISVFLTRINSFFRGIFKSERA